MLSQRYFYFSILALCCNQEAKLANQLPSKTQSWLTSSPQNWSTKKKIGLALVLAAGGYAIRKYKKIDRRSYTKLDNFLLGAALEAYDAKTQSTFNDFVNTTGNFSRMGPLVPYMVCTWHDRNNKAHELVASTGKMIQRFPKQGLINPGKYGLTIKSNDDTKRTGNNHLFFAYVYQETRPAEEYYRELIRLLDHIHQGGAISLSSREDRKTVYFRSIRMREVQMFNSDEGKKLDIQTQANIVAGWYFWWKGRPELEFLEYAQKLATQETKLRESLAQRQTPDKKGK